MGADLGRYLGFKPVEARAPKIGYKAWLWMKRNRLLTGVGAAALLAVIGGGSVSAAFALSAARAERSREAERITREEVSAFMVTDLLSYPEAERMQSGDMLVSEMLDGAVERLERSSRTARTKAVVRANLGRMYSQLGRADSAEKCLEGAYRSLKSLADGDDADLAGAALSYGVMLRDHNRPKEALAPLEESLEMNQRLHGPTSGESVEVLCAWAGVVPRLGRSDEAVQRLRGVLSEVGPGKENMPQLAMLRNTLAELLEASGDAEPAREFAMGALEAQRAWLGEENAAVASSMNRIGGLCIRLRRVEEGARYVNEALAMRRRLLQPNSTDIAQSLTYLATAQMQQNDAPAAVKSLNEALEMYRKAFKPGHTYIFRTLNVLGTALTMADRNEEALKVFTEAMEGYAADEIPDPRRAAVAQSQRGESYLRLGRYEEAERDLLAAFQTVSKPENARDVETKVRTARRLSSLYKQLGRDEESARWRDVSEQAAP